MSTSKQALQADFHQQDEQNRAVYHAQNVLWYYRRKSLLPPEVACLEKYESAWAGRDVLDVGVGTGRTSLFFMPRVRRYVAIDYSPVMLRYMKKHLPEVDVRRMDFRDLGTFTNGSFDFVLATANIIDALSHDGRIRALQESCRVLRPGGILAFSAHNLNYKLAFTGPRLQWSWNPVRLASKTAQFVLGSWNHRRIGPLRARFPEYALLNDPGHFYACLHYYAARETVRTQLENAGMHLLDVFNPQGRGVGANENDRENPWQLYVAQRVTP